MRFVVCVIFFIYANVTYSQIPGECYNALECRDHINICFDLLGKIPNTCPSLKPLIQVYLDDFTYKLGVYQGMREKREIADEIHNRYARIVESSEYQNDIKKPECLKLISSSSQEDVVNKDLQSKVEIFKCAVNETPSSCPNRKAFYQALLNQIECASKDPFSTACDQFNREAVRISNSSAFIRESESNPVCLRANTVCMSSNSTGSGTSSNQSSLSNDLAKIESENKKQLEKSNAELSKQKEAINKVVTNKNLEEEARKHFKDILATEMNFDEEEKIDYYLPEECQWEKYKGNILSYIFNEGGPCWDDFQRSGGPKVAVVKNNSDNSFWVQVCLEIYDHKKNLEKRKDCQILLLNPKQEKRIENCDATDKLVVNALPLELYSTEPGKCKQCLFPDEAKQVAESLKLFNLPRATASDQNDLLEMEYYIKPQYVDRCKTKSVYFEMGYKLMADGLIRNGMVTHPIAEQKLLDATLSASPELNARIKSENMNHTAFIQTIKSCRTYLSDDEGVYPGGGKWIKEKFGVPLFVLTSVTKPKEAFSVAIKGNLNEYDEYNGGSALVASDGVGLDIWATLSPSKGGPQKGGFSGCSHEPRCMEEYQKFDAKLEFINSSCYKMVLPSGFRWDETGYPLFFGPSSQVRHSMDGGINANCPQCGAAVSFQPVYPINSGETKTVYLNVNVSKGVPENFPFAMNPAGYFKMFTYENSNDGNKTPHAFVVGCEQTGKIGKAFGPSAKDRAYAEANLSGAKNIKLLYLGCSRAYVAIAKGKDETGKFYFVVKDSFSNANDAKESAITDLKKNPSVVRNSIVSEVFSTF